MKKYYINNLTNYDAVSGFDDDLYVSTQEDEKGHYFTDKEEFEWWETVANSIVIVDEYMDTLSAEERDDINFSINDFEDYNLLAERIKA